MKLALLLLALTLTGAVVTEARELLRAVRGQPKTFTGINFLLQYAVPNFWFHTTTGYAILRHCGIEMGKGDFIGALD
mgnify:CR=1 FL=1